MKKLFYIFILLIYSVCYAQPVFKVDKLQLGSILINSNNVLTTNNFSEKIEILPGLSADSTVNIFDITTNSFNISLTNDYNQVLILNTNITISISDKTSKSKIGQVRTYIYAQSNTVNFAGENIYTNGLDTNIVISSDSVTVLDFINPPFSTNWFVDQYKEYSLSINKTPSIIENVISYWPFNSDPFDYSGFGRDLTFISSNYVAGKIGQSANFTGTGGPNDYAYRNINDSIFNFGTNEITISFWVKTTTSSYSAMITKQDAPNPYRGWNIGYYPVAECGPENSIYFDIIENYPTRKFFKAATNQVVNNGQWNFICAVVKRSQNIQESQLWVNGIDVTTRNGLDYCSNLLTNLQNGNASTHLVVGARDSTEFQAKFTGSIDEVVIFDKALDENEISFLYNNGIGIDLSNYLP